LFNLFERFSIERSISYRVVGRGPVGASGSGKTVNMSSGGMLIETEQVLLPCDPEIFKAVMQHLSPGDIHDVNHRAPAVGRQ
jgi:hypothetical protein